MELSVQQTSLLDSQGIRHYALASEPRMGENSFQFGEMMTYGSCMEVIVELYDERAVASGLG